MKIGVKQWYPWAIRGENCVFVRPLVENTSVRRTDRQTDRSAYAAFAYVALA